MKKPCKNCQTLAELNSNQAKTIAELQAKVDTVNQTLALSLKNESDLEATITKLTGALKDIYSVTNEMQVMSIVMANLPTPKTIPPKEKT
jgi:ABC-type transporter Mla subunit MlaD